MGSIQEIIIGKGPSKTLRGKDDRRWTRNYCFKKRAESRKPEIQEREKRDRFMGDG